VTTRHHGHVVPSPAASPRGAVSAEGATSTYSGTRESSGATFVSVNGRPLNSRTDFRKASSTAFDWGYEGRGGPAQLVSGRRLDRGARLWQLTRRGAAPALKGV
jgi:hypothetical protein